MNLSIVIAYIWYVTWYPPPKKKSIINPQLRKYERTRVKFILSATSDLLTRVLHKRIEIHTVYRETKYISAHNRVQGSKIQVS